MKREDIVKYLYAISTVTPNYSYTRIILNIDDDTAEKKVVEAIDRAIEELEKLGGV